MCNTAKCRAQAVVPEPATMSTAFAKLLTIKIKKQVDGGKKTLANPADVRPKTLSLHLFKNSEWLPPAAIAKGKAPKL